MGIPVPGKDGLYIETGSRWRQLDMILSSLNMTQVLVQIIPSARFARSKDHIIWNFQALGVYAKAD